MLQTTNLVKTFGPGATLHFSDWYVGKGEQWLLLGESGSGKTTLLHMLTGILKPSAGRVMMEGIDLYRLTARELDRFRGRHIGIVFQQPHLIKSLTVRENLQLAQSLAALLVEKSRIKEILGELGMERKMDNYPSALSQGQLQRVAIARALINRPALLVADEPTSSLDNRNAEAVIGLLLNLSESTGSTLVISTHDDRVRSAFSKEHLFELTHEFTPNQLERS